jgi:eukaryotic-like serine/threonine-protein kinase
MQPNDDREANGGELLDYALDNHVIVEEGRYGFPAYTPGNIGDGDDIANVTVPNVVGLTQEAAESTIEGVGLRLGDQSLSSVGATTTNDGKVKSQTPAAGTTTNFNNEVDIVLFEAPTVPDVLGDDEATAEAALVAEGLVKGTVTTSTDGATELNDGTVKSTTPSAGTKVNTGSAVALVLFDFEG